MDPLVREALIPYRRAAGVALLFVALLSMFAAGRACGAGDVTSSADAGASRAR